MHLESWVEISKHFSLWVKLQQLNLFDRKKTQSKQIKSFLNKKKRSSFTKMGKDLRFDSAREESTLYKSDYPKEERKGRTGEGILSLTLSQVYLPVLPLCFLQATMLPWLLLLLALLLTFAPCCSGRAAACLPDLPPSAAAVTAFCSWEEVVNEWAIPRELTADWRLCDSWLCGDRQQRGKWWVGADVTCWCLAADLGNYVF